MHILQLVRRASLRRLLALVLGSSTGAWAQLAGSKTIGTDYPTLAAAIAALNAQGVGAGGVTFNVPATPKHLPAPRPAALPSAALRLAPARRPTRSYFKNRAVGPIRSSQPGRALRPRSTPLSRSRAPTT